MNRSTGSVLVSIKNLLALDSQLFLATLFF